MREGWTYKKLGEIGKIITGSTPSTKNAEYYSAKDYCFVKPSDLPSNGFIKLKATDYYLSEAGYNISRQLPKGSVLVSCIGIIGKTAILDVDACCNQQINAIIPNQDISSSFLAYSILSQRFKLESIANAPVVPIINKGDFSKIEIPLPPKSQQEAIVSELDEINSLLALKREQLQKYDKLAQSLFYEMFGDPVENDKGWEVKKFGEVGTFTRCNGIVKNDFVEQGKPCIHYGQIHTKFGPSIYSHLTEISEKLFDKSKKASTGDIIIAITSEDIEGSCKCTAWLGNYDIAVGAHAAIFKHNQNPLFVSYYFKSNAFFAEKSKYARGFKVMEIKPSDIEKIPIYLPPLTLQQQFASRIE